jgi:TusA-related sulfurtransferase
VRLERLAPGETLVLTLDDRRGARDIPRAAEAEGYAILETRAAGEVWILRIEK